MYKSNPSYNMLPAQGGGGGGRLMKGGRETQTGDQELSVIRGSQFIDKLVGQTMR